MFVCFCVVPKSVHPLLYFKDICSYLVLAISYALGHFKTLQDLVCREKDEIRSSSKKMDAEILKLFLCKLTFILKKTLIDKLIGKLKTAREYNKNYPKNNGRESILFKEFFMAGNSCSIQT